MPFNVNVLIKGPQIVKPWSLVDDDTEGINWRDYMDGTINGMCQET